MRLGQVEVAAEVEEGGLANAPAFAPALDQAEGVVDLAGGGSAGGGAANEHAPRVARDKGFGPPYLK